MSLSIIVLAAGKGSRMLSSRPKVLHEVGNYPMLFHVLDTATSLKNSNVNLVISKSLLAFRQEIKKRYPNIVFSLQEKQNTRQLLKRIILQVEFLLVLLLTKQEL